MQTFEATRDLIRSLFTPQELRRWSGKSDFYTLFLALAPRTKEKLSAREKLSIKDGLEAFREQVDQAKKKDNKRTFPEYVHEYAEAVTRAATDMGRREARLAILEERIEKAVEKARARQRRAS